MLNVTMYYVAAYVENRNNKSLQGMLITMYRAVEQPLQKLGDALNAGMDEEGC